MVLPLRLPALPPNALRARRPFPDRLLCQVTLPFLRLSDAVNLRPQEILALRPPPARQARRLHRRPPTPVSGSRPSANREVPAVVARQEKPEFLREGTAA